MSEMKFGLQIELNGHILHAVLSLPPESFRVLVQIRDDIFNSFANEKNSKVIENQALLNR